MKKKRKKNMRASDERTAMSQLSNHSTEFLLTVRRLEGALRPAATGAGNNDVNGNNGALLIASLSRAIVFPSPRGF